MTIEQKAKCYDDALKMAKKLYEQGTITESLAYIFPELAESEDEKARKEIIYHIKNCDDTIDEETEKRMLAWLENIPYTIDHEKREGFYLGYKAGLEKQSETFTKKDVEDAYVEDMAFAKNELEKQGEQKPTETAKWSPQEESCICQLESLVKERWRHAEKVNNAVDIKKMQELMFFLKTLNPNKKPQRMISAKAKEALYDKPDWSEEDERMCQETIDWFEKKCFPYALENENPARESIKWLKSLKNRVLPQPKQEWSEEDEKIALSIEQVMNCASLLNIVPEKVDKIRTWLKSLKDRYTWKPSDKQMKALDSVIDEYDGYPEFDSLVSLKNDLRKL